MHEWNSQNIQKYKKKPCVVNVAFYAFVTLQSSAYHLLGNLIISPVRRQSPPPKKKRKKHKRKAFFNEPLPTLKRKSGDMSGLPWISLDFVPTCFCCLYCTPYFVFFVFSEVSPWSPLFDDSAHLWMDLLSAQGFFIRIFFFFFKKIHTEAVAVEVVTLIFLVKENLQLPFVKQFLWPQLWKDNHHNWLNQVLWAQTKANLGWCINQPDISTSSSAGAASLQNN